MKQFLHSLIPDKDTIVIIVIALGYGLFAFFALLLLAAHNEKVARLEMLKTQAEMIESLQRRVPPTFSQKKYFDGMKVSTSTKTEDIRFFGGVDEYLKAEKALATINVGNIFLKNPEKYKQSEAQNDIVYRKHLCEQLGGTYREDFNTDQYDDGIPGYNGLREGAVYECSRVEPIFLAN